MVVPNSALNPRRTISPQPFTRQPFSPEECCICIHTYGRHCATRFLFQTSSHRSLPQSSPSVISPTKSNIDLGSSFTQSPRPFGSTLQVLQRTQQSYSKTRHHPGTWRPLFPLKKTTLPPLGWELHSPQPLAALLFIALSGGGRGNQVQKLASVSDHPPNRGRGRTTRVAREANTFHAPKTQQGHIHSVALTTRCSCRSKNITNTPQYSQHPSLGMVPATAATESR